MLLLIFKKNVCDGKFNFDLRKPVKIISYEILSTHKVQLLENFWKFIAYDIVCFFDSEIWLSTKHKI